MKYPPTKAGGVSLLSLVIVTPLGNELITMLIDDEVVMLLFVVSVEYQDIGHDAII